MLLKDAVKNFVIALEAKGRQKRTFGTYEERLKYFKQFAEAEGLHKLEDITLEDMDLWAVSMYRRTQRWTNHLTRSPVPGGLSDATIAGRIQAVQAFFKWCVQREHLPKSPAAHLEKPKLDHSVSSDKVMDRGDMDTLIDQAEKKLRSDKILSWRDYAMISFFIETGCREGEAAALRVSDLDLDACEARVNGKTGKRKLEYTEWTAKTMADWLKRRPEVDHDYVFASYRGTPLTESGIYQVFRRLAKAAGIQGPSNPHSIRHWVGQLFTDEKNLELARQKLGHSTVATTANYYAHQDRERVKEATKELSPFKGRVHKRPTD